MSILDWIILVWLVLLTIRSIFMNRGPKGDTGEARYSTIDVWDIKQASIQTLDDSEYMTKLIQKINSLQLNSGQKINDET